MASIVRLKQRDLALDLLLGNLTKDILRKMMLELAEGCHSVVDTVEQNKDAETGSSATTESYEQALNQARSD